MLLADRSENATEYPEKQPRECFVQHCISGNADKAIAEVL